MPLMDAGETNPLEGAWNEPFGLPAFDRIAPEHFKPAFERALARRRGEIEAIAADAAAPDFDNSIAALERSGHDLTRLTLIFFVLAGAHTGDALQEIERNVWPLLARHSHELYLNEPLFRRIDDLFRRRADLALTPEQRRVLDLYHNTFVRNGAALDPASKVRLAQIDERLASLQTAFGQNLLADERAYALVLSGPDDLAGLPDLVCAAAQAAAQERGMAGKHVITRSSIGSFLQLSARRDLRERAFQTWTRRGDGGGETDNKAIIAEIVGLRADRAKLLGYPSYAHCRLDDQMAKTPEAARALLEEVWPRALRRAARERDALQVMVRAEGESFALAPWDWRYYAEKLRKAQFDLDEAVIKPYLNLDRMIEAAFDTANRLFGLTFSRLADVPVYHPDARVWEVKDPQGRHIGLFIGDYFARPSKRGGAWCAALSFQQRLVGDTRPIIVNVMNFAKPPAGEPALLGSEEARMLFHEFGHGLIGLLSDVTYPIISGSMDSDFRELPSQLYEHWLARPEVLGRFAVHCGSNEPMPRPLLERLIETRNFNQGYATVQYVASAMIDLDFHLLGSAASLDVAAFERATLERIGMPADIVMALRPPHFQHVFATADYAASYYSYIWSEVLAADAFHAFEEAGDVFDGATAQRLRHSIYSAANLRDPAEAYRAFRGRLPTVAALLQKRGLDQETLEPAEIL